MRSGLLPMHVWKLRQEASKSRERLGHEKAVAVPGDRVGSFGVGIFLVQRKRSRGAGKGPVLAAASRTAFLPGSCSYEAEHSRRWLCFCFCGELLPARRQSADFFNARLPAFRAFDPPRPLAMAGPSPAPLPTRLFFWPETQFFREEIPRPVLETRPRANRRSAG